MAKRQDLREIEDAFRQMGLPEAEARHAARGRDLLEADLSFDRVRVAVGQALRDRFRTGDDDVGPWIRELFDDRVVFERNGDLWQATYAIDDEGQVTLEDPVEVEMEFVPVGKSSNPKESRGRSSRSLVPLSEADSADAALEDAFREMGLDEASATAAARGR